MTTLTAKRFYFSMISAAVFLFAFGLSSGLFGEIMRHGEEMALPRLANILKYHYNTLLIYPDARHYLLLPEGGYVGLSSTGFVRGVVFALLSSALFNALFQPIFLCVLTPQAVLNYLLFPFFIYGAIKYFKKVWPIVFFFIIFSVYIGLSGSVVEPLVRHRMPCELIYISIGVAGFTRWITGRLS
jgi:hypothetical protein